jgi:hypothetical protein
MDYSEAYGRSSGRCSKCPHLLLAWLGFLLARVFDMLLIALLALLWTLLGALANSPAAAALEALKQQQTKSLRFGDRVLMSKVSMTLRHASSELVKQGSAMLSPRILRRTGSSTAAAGRSSSGRQTLDDRSASFTAQNSYSQRYSQGAVSPKPPQQPSVFITSANSSPQPASVRSSSGMTTPSSGAQPPHALLQMLQSSSPLMPHTPLQEQQQQQSQQLQQYQPHQLSPVNSEEDVANIMSSPFAATQVDIEWQQQEEQQQQQQQQQVCRQPHQSRQSCSSVQPANAGLNVSLQQQQQQQQQNHHHLQQQRSQQLQQYQPHQLSPVNSEDEAADILTSPFAASQVNIGEQEQQEQQQQQQVYGQPHQGRQSRNGLPPPYAGLTVNLQQQQQQQQQHRHHQHLHNLTHQQQQQQQQQQLVHNMQQQQQQQLSSMGSMQLSPFVTHALQHPLPPPSPAAAAAARPAVLPSPTLMHSPTSLPGALMPTSHLASSSSITWSQAVRLFNQQQQQQLAAGGVRPGAALYSISSSDAALGALPSTTIAAAADDGDDVGVSRLPVDRLALLLIAVRHLACLAQVLLDGAQIAALILTQDLMFRVPAWVAVGLSSVLLTQASTWQWVAFDCLLLSSSKASGTAVQAMVVMLLPGKRETGQCCSWPSWDVLTANI